MSNPPNPEWISAISRLKDRMEQAELRHLMVMEELKKDLAGLEQRISHEVNAVEPKTPVVAPPPVAVFENEQQLPYLQKAKAEAQPPPLPDPPKREPVWDFEKQADPAPSVPPASKPEGPTFEQELGRVWLVRIGIVLLITGLVLGANWAYKNWIHHLSAGTRLTGLYLCSLLIGGTGIRLSKREGLQRYGEVLLAGGLAFFYYCTYAAHHVTRLKVIENPVTAAVLLLGAAGVIATVSWFRQSRTTAVMGIILASYATMIQPLDWLSAASNLVLAITGIALMLRPGWSAPGIASLCGTYGAFTGWQLMGAAGNGHGDLRATLWFLPASWAIFAIPGMLGRFRESLGERGRAVFTAANNGLFFATFSLTWLTAYGSEGFWKVPAVFGCVLLVMGLIGRKRDDTAAASNVIQALASLSLAVVLRFDGYHLGLALAAESLALALAFHRFHKRAEFIFSLLAGLGAAAMALFLHLPMFHQVPAWSGALSAVLVAMSAGIFRFNVDRATDPPAHLTRLAASLLAYASLAILVIGWCLRLPSEWQLPVEAGLAAGFVVLSLTVDRRRLMPEIAWASAIMGIVAALGMVVPTTDLGHGLALLSAVVACAVWHLPPGRDRHDVTFAADPFETPQAFAWGFAMFVPLLFSRVVGAQEWDTATQIGVLAGGAVGFVGLARATKAHRLEITSTFLSVGSLLMLLGVLMNEQQLVSKSLSFAPAAAAAAILGIVAFRRGPEGLPQLMITRATLFVAWAAALLVASPEGFIDVMALSAGAAFAVARWRKAVAPIDAWGWMLASLFAFAGVLIEGNDSRFHGYTFEGIALVALLAAIALVTPKIPKSKFLEDFPKVLPWLACLVFTIWSTHLVVDFMGWKAVAVLWTILGFGLVSMGLILNRVTSRQAGFILLSLALLKLFFIDVWDFTTFMRVISFIALGLALVVLGLFYHRFAPALKRLIEEESAAQTKSNPSD